MAEHLAQKLKEAGASRVSIEGMPQCDWVLIDGGDVIVHLFRPEIRSFYNLEKMWGEVLPRPASGPRPSADGAPRAAPGRPPPP